MQLTDLWDSIFLKGFSMAHVCSWFEFRLNSRFKRGVFSVVCTHVKTRYLFRPIRHPPHRLHCFERVYFSPSVWALLWWACWSCRGCSADSRISGSLIFFAFFASFATTLSNSQFRFSASKAEVAIRTKIKIKLGNAHQYIKIV